MKTPSILSAVKKLRQLLTRREKLSWLFIAGFALTVSFLEVVTASIIVIFAQVLTDPSVGNAYMVRIGFSGSLSPARVVFYFSLMVGVVYLIKNIIAGIEVFFQNFSIQKMSYEFKKKLLYKYAQSDYGVYLTRNSSFGLQVLSGDVQQAFSSGMIGLASILSEGFVFLCLISMMIYLNPNLAFLIFVVGIFLFLLMSRVVFPLFYRWGQRLQQASIGINQNLLQFFHAFKEIVLLGKKKAFIDAFQVHSGKYSRLQALITATNSLPRLFIETLFVGVFVLVITYLSAEHESPMQMIGLLGGYLYMGFRLMPGINRILNQLNILKSVTPAIDRIYDEFTTVATPQHYINEPNFRFDKSVSFEGVSFQYLNTSKKALSNVSFKIKKGECIGVVGQTGSGKSTLIDLMLGLLRPTEGKILVDGKFPVNSIQWNQKIGYVPQAIYLTDDTIEANIAFGEELIDKDRLDAAIDSAQLRSFINALPEGGQTFVGERGIRLSGGERQRISIARALYRDPEVLIFDEATSALDNETEKKLMETIYDVSRTRTVIMIAHRLSTLERCDRLFEFSQGKVSSKDLTQ
ncbi:MAG: ABC transporter ATP-binding protein [Rickettsiales bacterium]|nr:ABC transporter ATP-binding protein [Rickettsiales bacterium]|tara:strand:+ start:9798 stop:11528 length:1731 start_codon:yes stop_codon:yes gene_type:complete